MDNIKSKHDTSKEFAAMTALCRDIFIKKMSDYGMSWRVMRPSSLTDQIYIKARRIRSIEEKGMASARVNEGIEPEFIGIVNYCAIALIQLRIGPGDYISQEWLFGKKTWKNYWSRLTILMNYFHILQYYLRNVIVENM